MTKRRIGGGIGLLLTVGLGLVLWPSDLRERNPKVAADSPLTGRLLGVIEGLKIGQTLIHQSYDLPFRWRPVIEPHEVVLVYLDDASHEGLGQPYDASWDRGLYGRLVERLTAEGARATAFDMVFTTPNTNNAQGDERFARALKANGRVILAADYLPSEGGGMELYRACDLLFDAANGYGFAQLAQDQDFIVRRHVHVPYEEGSDRLSSLSWQLARIAGARSVGGAAAQPLYQSRDREEAAQVTDDRSRERWVNYYGPAGFIPHISFITTLETNDFCPAGCFSNKVVIVGGNVKTHFSGERKDELRTPFTRFRDFVPAVDTQATLTLNLLRGDSLKRTPPLTEVALFILAGALFGFGLSLFKPLPAAGIALAGALCTALAAYGLFSYARLWFPWLVIAGAEIPIALLWSIGFNSVELYVQNRLYQQSLQMYLPSKLVRKFSGNKDLLKPGAHKEILTLLFSDIADFTTLSDGMDPEELAHLMNEYFQAAVGGCIHHTDGTVGKFIGDGIFAFWNAPDQQQDHAVRACQAGLRFMELNRRPIRGRQLRTRIGLHTGAVHVGNFGSADRIDYTALGDHVNLASRIEGLNKFLSTECLISSRTRSEIGDHFVTRALGSFRLKGFASVVEVHELMGLAEAAEATRAWRETFAQALRNYEERNLEFAELGFRQTLQDKPEDGPSLFYLKQIAERALENLPEGTWTSYTVLKEK